MTFALQTAHILHLSLVLVRLWTVEVEKKEAGPTYPSFLQSHDAEMHGVFVEKNMALVVPQTWVKITAVYSLA